jgi:2-polyprenyl-6-hydroxyphenyl methylase/3-demethylubiquinone-9 3-methyltransferase
MTAAGTAEPEEIARFERLAANWWDEAGPMRPLHQLNPPRIAFLRDHLAAHFGRDPKATKPFAGLTLLDVGCGAGLLCEPMTRLGFAVTGIDAAAGNIEVAKRHAETMGLAIDYRNATPEDLSGDLSGQFDVILAMEVVEHVADVPAFMTAMAGLAKPGAAFFASTLNRTAKAFAMAIVGAEYVMRWLPRGTHDWKKFLKPSELSRGLRQGGLTVREIVGMTYNPLARTWHSGSDLAVNYMLWAEKPTNT